MAFTIYVCPSDMALRRNCDFILQRCQEGTLQLCRHFLAHPVVNVFYVPGVLNPFLILELLPFLDICMFLLYIWHECAQMFYFFVLIRIYSCLDICILSPLEWHCSRSATNCSPQELGGTEKIFYFLYSDTPI